MIKSIIGMVFMMNNKEKKKRGKTLTMYKSAGHELHLSESQPQYDF